jgi:hypothetical protein
MPDSYKPLENKKAAVELLERFVGDFDTSDIEY